MKLQSWSKELTQSQLKQIAKLFVKETGAKLSTKIYVIDKYERMKEFWDSSNYTLTNLWLLKNSKVGGWFNREENTIIVAPWTTHDKDILENLGVQVKKQSDELVLSFVLLHELTHAWDKSLGKECIHTATPGSAGYQSQSHEVHANEIAINIIEKHYETLYKIFKLRKEEYGDVTISKETKEYFEKQKRNSAIFDELPF